MSQGGQRGVRTSPDAGERVKEGLVGARKVKDEELGSADSATEAARMYSSIQGLL